MKYFLIVFSLLILLTSCLGEKKYADFVYNKYNSQTQAADLTKDAPDYISVKADSSINKLDTLVVAKKLKSQFIPAILYWQWENTIRCELDPKISIRTFNKYLFSYADSANLKERLNGQKLELSINDLPNSFVYTHKGNSIILLIAYTVNDTEAIIPENKDVKISYRLVKDNIETKKGTLLIPDETQAMQNIWKSTQKFTWSYMSQYDNNLQKLSKNVIDKILTEI